MSKPVGYLNTLYFFKTEFDLLYSSNITNKDPIKVQKSVDRMYLLQSKIFEELKKSDLRAFAIEKIQQDMRLKLVSLLNHTSTFSSVAARTEQISLSALSSANPGSSEKTQTATDFAVGFGNLNANCWANSLLSMLLSMPNFKHAYETVANYYIQKDVNSPDHLHGKALLKALQSYYTALTTKQPVPSSVSQDFRLAFHHFFGHLNSQTHYEIFSSQPWHQEDAWEGMQVLMGRYEQIVRETTNTDIPVVPYSTLQTKRFYQPVGEPRAADPERTRKDDYSKLTIDNVSSVVNYDYQIILDLQNKGHLCFSDLLSEYFRNTHLEGHDTGVYLLPNGQVQHFKLIGESRQFTQIPDELLLTIKRFGATQNGTTFKIATPISIKQTIFLPKQATNTEAPVAYALDTFNVHAGEYGSGHYLAYRKIDGHWIEVNDGTVRFVSDQEIDQILCGQKKTTFTSYMHHYIRTAQPQRIDSNADATSAYSILASEINNLSHQKMVCEQTIQQLERLNKLLKTDASPSLLSTALMEIGKIDPKVLTSMQYAVWLNDKTPDVYDYGATAITNNPYRLREICNPWLIFSFRTTLVEQLLLLQKNKLEMITERFYENVLLSFHEKLRISTSNEELKTTFSLLPIPLINSIHELIYLSHLKKFGRNHVDKEEYRDDYGRVALESGDLKTTLLEATESVLNIWGKTILEQLIAKHHVQAKKLQCAYDKDQLQAFHDLSLRSPSEISNHQLLKTFEHLDLRPEIKEKLYWQIWFSHFEPNIPNYGTDKFKENPRCLLGIRSPNLARAPICATGSNILFQMIKLLEKEAR